MQLGFKEPRSLKKKWLIYGIYGHTHRKRAILSNAVQGVSSPGHLLFICYSRVLCYSLLCFRFATSHSVKTPENTPFFTQNSPCLTHKSKKRCFFEKSAMSCPMMRGIAKRQVLFPNEAFLVAKSALGPYGPIHHIPTCTQ